MITTRTCNTVADVYMWTSWGGAMLSLAKAHKDYYLSKVGEISPREDYYLKRGTASGRWHGSGATELGLDGVVSAEGLVRLFDGQHPETGEQLGHRLRKDGVAAWDLTFSADKSVSLLWAFGDDATRRHVVEAFEEATAEAVAYMESVASSTRECPAQRSWTTTVAQSLVKMGLSVFAWRRGRSAPTDTWRRRLRSSPLGRMTLRSTPMSLLGTASRASTECDAQSTGVSYTATSSLPGISTRLSCGAVSRNVSGSGGSRSATVWLTLRALPGIRSWRSRSDANRSKRGVTPTVLPILLRGTRLQPWLPVAPSGTTRSIR